MGGPVTLTAIDTVPPTRITLLDDAGASVARWTLQDPDREARVIRWRPEGRLALLGSGRGFERRWVHRGFRLEISLNWTAGITSSREAFAGGAWGPREELTTAQAHCEILGWAAAYRVRVEPFVGQPMPAFLAIATEEGPSLEDTAGVVHRDLALNLQGRHLVRGVTIVRTINGGWGIGPWGLMPWGF